MTVVNRVVVAPMDMYSAVDGTPGEFHLVASGHARDWRRRARHHGDGVRVARTRASRRLRRHVRAASTSRPGGGSSTSCTGRAARRCACSSATPGRRARPRCRGWRRGSCRSTKATGTLIAPSAVRYAPQLQVPREMTRADMDRVRDEFVAAARMGVEAGFDMLELHCAHGYLMSAFITPLSNRRTDEYGGSLDEPRAVSRRGLPRHASGMAGGSADVRARLRDRLGGGRRDRRDAVAIAKAFVDAGVDIIHVSTGQTSIAGEAGVRPHVSDAVQRSDPERDAHSHDRRRQHHGCRAGERDHRRRPRGSVRAGAGRTWRIRSGRCARRRNSATRTSTGRVQYLTGRRQLERSSREAQLTMNARVTRAARPACGRHRRRRGTRRGDRGGIRGRRRHAHVDGPDAGDARQRDGRRRSADVSGVARTAVDLRRRGSGHR